MTGKRLERQAGGPSGRQQGACGVSKWGSIVLTSAFQGNNFRGNEEDRWEHEQPLLACL